MKKLRFTCLGILTLALAVHVPAEAKSVPKLSVKEMALPLGQKKKVKVLNTKKKVTWATNNEKVATVSKKGVVTAKKRGYAVVTATFGKKTLRCRIEVKPKAGAMKKKTSKILNELFGKNYKKYPEIERAYLIAKWLCDNCEMDEAAEAYNRQAESDSEYTYAFHADGPLLKGKAISYGYTEAYRLLLSKVGIKSRIIYDDFTEPLLQYPFRHYAGVRIDGKWYRCDVANMDSPTDAGPYNWVYFMSSNEKNPDWIYMATDETNDDMPVFRSTKYQNFNEKYADIIKKYE